MTCCLTKSNSPPPMDEDDQTSTVEHTSHMIEALNLWQYDKYASSVNWKSERWTANRILKI